MKKSISWYQLYKRKCDYLGMIDKEQDSLLWDGCKECSIRYPKDL